MGLTGPRGKRGGVYRCQKKKSGSGRHAIACFVDLPSTTTSRSVRVTIARAGKQVATSTHTLRHGQRRVALTSNAQVSRRGSYRVQVTVVARGHRTTYSGTYRIR